MAQVFQGKHNGYSPGRNGQGRALNPGTRPLSQSVAEERIRRLLDLLSSEALVNRLKAIGGLAALPESDPLIVQALERVAASDPSDVVRECAYQALQEASLRPLRASQSDLSPEVQRFILSEINKWEADGLIEPFVARVLKLRHTPPAAQH